MDDHAFLHGAVEATELPARPAHRPTTYNKEVALKICDRIAAGDTLRSIGADPDFPGRTTMFRWLAENEEFAQQYAAALQWRTEHRADEIIEIADDSSKDYLLHAGDANCPPALVLDKEAIARSKLRIDARKWLMAKEMPRKYGEVVAAPPAPSSPPPGDGAKLVNPPGSPTLIEQDPLYTELKAYERVIGTAAAKSQT